MIDMSHIGCSKLDPACYLRPLPLSNHIHGLLLRNLDEWIHISLHAFSTAKDQSFFQTSLFAKSFYQGLPLRHYDKVTYDYTFKEDDEYTITFGEKDPANLLNGEFSFFIDDFVISQGGTIFTTTLSIAKKFIT